MEIWGFPYWESWGIFFGSFQCPCLPLCQISALYYFFLGFNVYLLIQMGYDDYQLLEFCVLN